MTPEQVKTQIAVLEQLLLDRKSLTQELAATKSRLAEARTIIEKLALVLPPQADGYDEATAWLNRHSKNEDA